MSSLDPVPDQPVGKPAQNPASEPQTEAPGMRTQNYVDVIDVNPIWEKIDKKLASE